MCVCVCVRSESLLKHEHTWKCVVMDRMFNGDNKRLARNEKNAFSFGAKVYEATENESGENVTSKSNASLAYFDADMHAYRLL